MALLGSPAFTISPGGDSDLEYWHKIGKEKFSKGKGRCYFQKMEEDTGLAKTCDIPNNM